MSELEPGNNYKCSTFLIIHVTVKYKLAGYLKTLSLHEMHFNLYGTFQIKSNQDIFIFIELYTIQISK